MAVCSIVLQPVWFSTPYLLLIWGLWGGWRPLYWIPPLCFGVAAQLLCAGGLWYPSAAYIASGPGLALTVICTILCSVIVTGPLFMQPICGNGCIPLQNLIAYMAAVMGYAAMQARSRLLLLLSYLTLIEFVLDSSRSYPSRDRSVSHTKSHALVTHSRYLMDIFQIVHCRL